MTLGPAERLVGYIRNRPRRGIGFVSRDLVEGMAQNGQQLREGHHVFLIDCSGKGFFDLVVPRDIDRIHPVHRRRASLRCNSILI